MNSAGLQKISVVGNVAGGKTRLSRSLALRYNLPLIHVDSLQFLPGLKLRPFMETKQLLSEEISKSQWIIDGYGPLDIIVQRFEKSDIVVFVDFPLWRHQWWFLKRQIKSLFLKRTELPEGSREATWKHTVKVWKSMGSSHRQMRPELLRIFSREKFKDKVIYIRTLQEWRVLNKKGF